MHQNIVRTKRLIAVALIGAGLSVAGVASAAWSSTWRTITSIYAQDGGLRVTLSGDNSCSEQYQLPMSTANYQVKASALLSAYYAGHEILVEYDSGNKAGCNTEMYKFKARP